MKPHRVLAIARKELLHILRDNRSLIMAIAIPVLMLVLYGYALNLDVDHIPLVVFDQSQTPESRDYISRFTGSRCFVNCDRAVSYSDVEQDINRGAAMAALVIPADFGKEKGMPKYSAQFIIDGSDPTVAAQAQAYANAITEAFGASLAPRLLRRSGLVTHSPMVNVCQRAWYNPDLRSRNYLLPALIAIMMTVISTVQTSLIIAREWEAGTMEQLISTPVKPSELILGKLSPYFVIGMLNVSIAVLTARFIFDLPIRGSIGLLFLMAAVFHIGALGQGMLISVVSRSQLVANQLALITSLLPALLLSGFTFPISAMPRSIQYVTAAIPAKYFVTLLRGIYLKESDLCVLTLETRFLAAFAVLVILIAFVLFRKKLV